MSALCRKNGALRRISGSASTSAPPVSSGAPGSRDTCHSTPKPSRSARYASIWSARWLTFTISRSAPAAIRRRATRSSIGTPPTGISGLGVWSVSGRRRVPSPAARIIASTAGLRRARHARGLLLRLGLGQFRRLGLVGGPLPLFAVRDHHVHRRELPPQVVGQAVGEVHRAVLPARAPEPGVQRG